VAVGITDADTLVALGISPVAAYPNTGFGEGTFFPWLNGRAELASTKPLALTDDQTAPQIEALAALRPDLIFAVNVYNDAENLYQKLSAIAPTVAPSDDPVTMSWADHTTEIGRALGREDDAEALVDDIEARIATAAADNPRSTERPSPSAACSTPQAPS
jgi:iron complex transport system substrate-binding protein